MKKVIGDFSTNVKMIADEAKSICRIGQGEKCCAFLVCGPDGFEYIRMDYPTNSSIFSRLKEGSMNAKGEGGWKDCAWEGEL